jgi:hypothetical protein
MGWKEGKESMNGKQASEVGSAERDVVGKKTSEEGVVVAMEVREVK